MLHQITSNKTLKRNWTKPTPHKKNTKNEWKRVKSWARYATTMLLEIVCRDSVNEKCKKYTNFIWESMYEKLKYSFGTLFLRHLLEMHGTAIFSGHQSHPHPKVYAFAGQRQLHFSMVLRPWVLARSRESNPRPFRSTVNRSADWANPRSDQKTKNLNVK